MGKSGVLIEKDYFADCAKKIVEIITESSDSSEDEYNEQAIFDPNTRKVKVTTVISPLDKNPSVEEERRACAEKLQVGDKLNIKVNLNSWEFYSAEGESLGEMLSWFVINVFCYINRINVINGKVVSKTTKSSKRHGKYTLVTISFDVVERRPLESVAQEDMDTMERFIYSIENNEAKILKWIGSKSEKVAVIPEKIEGVPVTALSGQIFSPDYTIISEVNVEEIIIANGIKRIETGALFDGDKFKKIIFPESVEYISPDVFASEEGKYRDSYLAEDTIYVVPAGSYAENFLKNYKVERRSFASLNVVSEGSTAKTN